MATNSRMNAIFKQACLHVDYKPEHVPMELVQKYAEMVVLECCDIFTSSKAFTAELALKEVKARFGIRG